MKFLKDTLSYARMCLSVQWDIAKDLFEALVVRTVTLGERHYVAYLILLPILAALVCVLSAFKGLFSAWRDTLGSLSWRDFTPKFWRENIRE